MGQGSYVICELDSIYKENSYFQQSLANLETAMINKCSMEWKPRSFGSLTPTQDQFGRTTILPGIFGDHNGLLAPLVTWRQLFITAGHQLLMTGGRTGFTIPEDIKVAWAGIALPNKNQELTEIKFQIGDRKFGRIDLEELHLYNKPALIFEEGYILDEEESFDLWGYIEGPIPVMHDGYTGAWQRIILLGAAYYKFYDKVGGNCGAQII
jgi:hypothetical protein